VEEHLTQKDLLTLQTTCTYCGMQIGRFRKMSERINEVGEKVKFEEIGAIIMYPPGPPQTTFGPCMTCCKLFEVYTMLKNRVSEIKIFPFPKPENGGRTSAPTTNFNRENCSPQNTQATNRSPFGTEEDTSMAEGSMDLSTEPGGSSGPYHF
jgi:hypothetical protein